VLRVFNFSEHVPVCVSGSVYEKDGYDSFKQHAVEYVRLLKKKNLRNRQPFVRQCTPVYTGGCCPTMFSVYSFLIVHLSDVKY